MTGDGKLFIVVPTATPGTVATATPPRSIDSVKTSDGMLSIWNFPSGPVNTLNARPGTCTSRPPSGCVSPAQTVNWPLMPPPGASAPVEPVGPVAPLAPGNPGGPWPPLGPAGPVAPVL